MAGTTSISGALIELYQGASVTLSITVTDTDDNPVDLTGTTLVLTVREAVACEPVLLRKDTSVPAEGAITSPTLGKAEFYILAADTGVLLPRDYVYDVWLDDYPASGDRMLIIKPSVLRILDPVRSYPDP